MKKFTTFMIVVTLVCLSAVTAFAGPKFQQATVVDVTTADVGPSSINVEVTQKGILLTINNPRVVGQGGKTFPLWKANLASALHAGENTNLFFTSGEVKDRNRSSISFFLPNWPEQTRVDTVDHFWAIGIDWNDGDGTLALDPNDPWVVWEKKGWGSGPNLDTLAIGIVFCYDATTKTTTVVPLKSFNQGKLAAGPNPGLCRAVISPTTPAPSQ